MEKVSNDTKKSKTDSKLEHARNLLAPFLRNNSASSVKRIKQPFNGIAVTEPWGDTSIQIVLPSKPKALVEALNNVFLPERFTAIWHLDTETFEIIYTVYPIAEAGRSFSFVHNGVTYECEYADSSTTLLLLAEHFYPTGEPPSTTEYRNLAPYSDFVLSKQHVKGFRKIPDAKPVSFWIRGLKWDPDVALDLARHLNFFMSYFDTQSAQIMMHSPVSETTAMQPETRFRAGAFPKQIISRPIEENLFHFWRATKEDSDPIRCFINNYLILEYAAFFYIDETVKRNIRKCLIDPNGAVDIEAQTRRLVEALGEKIQEDQRVQHVLKNCVTPKVVWQEIQRNRDFFSQGWKFDGGFSLEPMITKETTEKEFSINWEITFEKKIRSIRNALSHSKELRSLSTISPTARNFELLQAWVPPIAVAAQEVMVYRDIA
jgi:hypothetical protein